MAFTAFLLCFEKLNLAHIFVEMPFSPRSKSVRMFSDEVSESTSIDGDEAVVRLVFYYIDCQGCCRQSKISIFKLTPRNLKISFVMICFFIMSVLTGTCTRKLLLNVC